MDTNVQSLSLANGRYASPSAVSVLSHASCGTLHVAGDVSLLDKGGVAVVGSRKASQAALEQAASVATTLVNNGFVVISGFASGVDAASHSAAIRSGGSTIGVIGTSLERAYPASSTALQERMYRDHLL